MKHHMNHLRSIRKQVVLALVLGLGIFAVEAFATTTEFSEDADFSNNSASPTVISPSLQLGTNTIHGTVDASQWSSDNDYFRITLPDASRLAGVKITVTNFSAGSGSYGLFEILHAADQNTGSVALVGNNSYDVPFIIGTPSNIVLHVLAPFVFELGTTSALNYEVELVVAPIEVIGGTQIFTAVEVTFPTEANVYYQVQCTSDLASDAWINLGKPVLGTGDVLTAFDTTRRAQQRFYRVTKQ